MGFTFADNCALVAQDFEDIQFSMECFAHTAHFGLIVSLKKTEIMFQPRSGAPYIPPVVKVYDAPLRTVDKWTVDK